MSSNTTDAPPPDIELLFRENELPSMKERPSITTSRTLPVVLNRLSWFRRLGVGIRLDIRSRAPWYLSDWTDAWNYRVVPATALIFFAK